MSKKNNGTKYSSVSLPIPLLKKIKKAMISTGFKSVSDCVGFILRETIIEKGKEKKIDKKIIENIKKRLRDLEYIK
jgi:metal-responsive CopG/Arc/MetJ family transcriptional regulator